MTWYVCVLIGFALLCALYLWLIAPSRRHPDAGALLGKLYAHRGLHDGNKTVYENSLPAFERAVASGYGIELDVQLTKDNQLVVHHDGNTLRVCGVDKEIHTTPYADLPPLPDGTPIPTFAQALALVDGQIPLIVEVKYHGDPIQNTAAALAELANYHGPYCVESFHPMVVRYVRKHAPHVLRGQLASGGQYRPADGPFLQHFALKHLLVNVLSRPHFVAYACATDSNLSMWLMKRLFRPILVAWTIRDQALLTQAQAEYQMPIFELFTPAEKR